MEPRGVILVEGLSDQAAVEALAERRGRDLAAEGVQVVAIGGVQAIGRHVERFGPLGLGIELAGLCDAGEERDVRRGLERGGFRVRGGRGALEARRFFVCVDDLEDELIRALGMAHVEEVLELEGDLRSFRTLQKQPAQRGRPVEAQLRRFFGSGSGRKIRYARLLVEAVDPARVPRPLDRLLASV